MSIFFNVIAGFALAFDDDKDIPEIRLGFSFKDEKPRLVVGVLAMAAGILKLLSPVGESVVILGDLIPAAAGFASGLTLFLEYYRKHTVIIRDDDEKPKLNTVLFKNRKFVGIAAIAVSALHFLFPRIPLL